MGWNYAERMADLAPKIDSLNKAEKFEEYTLYGRSFAVVAKFEGEDYMDQANAYMDLYPDTGLLAENGRVAFIAKLTDKGRPVGR